MEIDGNAHCEAFVPGGLEEVRLAPCEGAFFLMDVIN
jgi:hypothetical protein